MEKITNKYVVIERSMSDTEDGTVWIADTWADSRAIRDAIKARGNGYVTNMGESHDLTPATGARTAHRATWPWLWPWIAWKLRTANKPPA